MTHVALRIVNNVSFVSRINHEIHFLWQAQYLVKFKCHFSWQAQYSVKFGMIAGARNVVFFTTKCSWWAGCEAGCGLTVSWSDHARIMLGSFSDHGRIGRALEMTFHPFSANFFEILDGHFSWQAQYLVSL